MLPETWLYNDEMSVLSNMHTHFSGCDIVSMNTELRLVSGCPYCGLSINRRKALDKSCGVVKYVDESIIVG